MKPTHFIAPLLALGGSAAWIYSQQEPLTDLEERTQILQERITEVKSLRDKTAATGKKGSPGGKKSQDDKFLLPDGSLDWATIAEVMKNNRTRMGQDMRLMMRLQQKMMAMTPEEITENIAKIRALDLTDEIRDGLESQLIMLLSQKDPESAMSLLSDSLNKKHNQQSWQMKHAFGEWSKKDPAAAMAWMDKQVEDGKFVSKSLDPSDNPRLEFETRLMGSLFHEDPSSVRKRLEQFSKEEQSQILQDHRQWNQKGKVTQDYLELVRENYAEDKVAALIGDAVTAQVQQEGLESASKAIVDFNLTPEERKEALDSAIDNFSQRWDGTEADITEVYPWAQKEDPERAAELTARALTSQIRRGQDKMQSTFESAVQIAENTGQPEIMDHFMKYNRAHGTLEQQLSQFKDETLKEQYRSLYEAGAQTEETE